MTSTLTLSAAAVLIVVAGSLGAAAKGVTLLPGQPYVQVHAQLASAGYKPYRVLRRDSELYHRNIFNRGDVARRYPDVLDCAGSGLGDCRFVLRRDRTDIIVVHTTGELASQLVFRDLSHATRAQADGLYR